MLQPGRQWWQMSLLKWSIHIIFKISHCTRKFEMPWNLTAQIWKKMDTDTPKFSNNPKNLSDICSISCKTGSAFSKPSIIKNHIFFFFFCVCAGTGNHTWLSCMAGENCWATVARPLLFLVHMHCQVPKQLSLLHMCTHIHIHKYVHMHAHIYLNFKIVFKRIIHKTIIPNEINHKQNLKVLTVINIIPATKSHPPQNSKFLFNAVSSCLECSELKVR